MNKFDPKGGKADGLPHQVSAGTPGGTTGPRKGQANPGGREDIGGFTSGNLAKGKSKGAKTRDGFLGGKRGPGFDVVTK